MLAQLALEAALAAPDVVHSDAGRLGTWVTEASGERLAGVVSAALGDGRYAVSLHLIVRPVPLHELAERIRGRVISAAGLAGLGDVLATVDVSIEDVAVEPVAGAS